jgi:dihydrofolate reductase
MYEQPSRVLTHRRQIIVEGHPVQAFHGDVSELHPKLVSAAAGKDVWVVGRGEAAAQFVTAGLVDEVIFTYTPWSLGAGARLLPVRSEWVLVESAINGDFACVRWRKA